jgi:hypothetical protein
MFVKLSGVERVVADGTYQDEAWARLDCMGTEGGGDEVGGRRFTFLCFVFVLSALYNM